MREAKQIIKMCLLEPNVDGNVIRLLECQTRSYPISVHEKWLVMIIHKTKWKAVNMN